LVLAGTSLGRFGGMLHLADSFREGMAMIVLHEVVRRLRAEYLEMPGLRLSAAQVERLCGVERTICQTALDTLVDEGFLQVSPDGRYARLTDGEIPRPRAAKAQLRKGKGSAKAS
jgi:DNA-binding IclR family transcriptional regulator